MNARLSQFGIIGFSALLMISIGLFAFQSLNQLSQSNVLNAEPEENTASSPSYEARIAKGNDYFKNGFYEEAASEYAYANSLQKENPEPYLKLSVTYSALNELSKAEENAKKAYELEKNQGSIKPSTLARTSHCLLSNQKIEEALALLNSYSEPDQNILYVKGLAALIQGQEAKSFFEQAATQSGSLAPATLQLFLTAYQSFEAAQGSDSSYLNALLSKALLDANEAPLAEQLALSTLKVKSDYRDLWMILGYSQLEQNKLAEAEDSFTAAKKIDSIKPEVHYLLGEVHFLQQEYDASIREMELALLYDFEPAIEAYKKIAESHAALGHYEEALAAYEAMLTRNPSSITFFKTPIDLAINQVQDLDRAQSLAQKGVDLFPSEALAHTLLANVYLKKSNLELASEEITKALSLNSNEAETHLVAGQIHEQENKLESAKSEYKKAFELSEAGDSNNTKAAESYNRLMTTTP